MSLRTEDGGTVSPSYPSSSIEDSFHLISRESRENSVEIYNDSAAPPYEQHNHISLTEQDQAATDHSWETEGDSREADTSCYARSPPATTPCDQTPPVPKPRTTMHAIRLDPTTPISPCQAVFPGAGFAHTPSTSSTGQGSVGSPGPIPRPRPRSGSIARVELIAERRKMEEKWEAERQQLQEEIVQLRSDINWKDRELEASRGEGVGASSSAESEITQLKAELDHAKETIRELQSTHGELEGQSPGVDVEASLRLEAMVREKTTALQYAVDESLQLQTTIREKESALWEKETALVKSESRAEGLQEQVKALRSPLQTDPRRRVELRLNEEIGKLKKAETELRLLKERRDGYQQESEEARRRRENLERVNRDLKSEVDRVVREKETERERQQMAIGQLEADKRRLAEEKTRIETEQLQRLQQEREALQRELEEMRAEGKRERAKLEEQLEQERVNVQQTEKRRKSASEEMHQRHQSRERQLQEQLEQAEGRKQHELGEMQQQRDALQASKSQLEQSCGDLRQQLSSANNRVAAAQKKEQENSQQLQQELEETRQTCEAFKGEVTSLLTDLQEQGEMIRKVEAEKDVLRNQVEGMRRKLAADQEKMKQMEADMGHSREREQRLQAQRDELQSREEIMGYQLKQYMSDFEEERASREKMGEVVQLLQKREKDNEGEIIRLRKNVTELSTEKNELAFICEQLRQQIQSMSQ